MVLKVAHRGDPLRLRENTLPSLASAIDGGADCVEIDVRLTRDGVPVLLHDDTLRRLWGVSRPLASVREDELEQLVGRDQWRIPTLADALELVVGRGVSLMIDIPGPAEGRAAIETVRADARVDKVVFAGDPTALGEVRATLPGAVIAMSWKKPWQPGAALMDHVRPDYLNQRHIWVTRRGVRTTHARGLKACAWTVDRPRRMAALAALGVDAVITNDIRALTATLESPAPAP